MIGDEIGQIKTFLDIGVVFLGKPPNFGQIYGLIPKSGNFDADQPCFWTWLNPFGGLIGERSVRPLRFFPLSPSFFFFLPSLSFIFLLAHILARPFILTLARACPFPLPPGDHPLSADFAVCAFADAEACALRAGLFFISFSRSFFFARARLRAFGLGASFAANAGRPRFALVLARGALRLVPGRPRNPTGKL